MRKRGHRLLGTTQGLVVVAVFALCMVGPALPALAHGTFWDDDGSPHEAPIEALAEEGITHGCNPPLDDRYCPNVEVTRGQMAAYLARALDLPASTGDHFTDDDDSVFEADIERIAEAGITRGCNPPENDRYCPAVRIPRDQMAAFLDRAFLEITAAPDAYEDDEGNDFEAHIDRIAQAGISKGCNPPENDRYCPDEFVTRAQMASFVRRAAGYDHTDPTAGDHDMVITYTVGTQGAPDHGLSRLFGTRVHEALHSGTALSRDGWNIDGRIFFRPVASGGMLHFWLTDDNQVGEKAPVCSDQWSCTVGNDIYINDENFANATDTWSSRDLADYQRYVVNHETGHFLDFDRRSHANDPALCGAKGQAPVMMQQSIDLLGCTTNVWPLGWERDCVEEALLIDTVDQGGVLAGQCPEGFRDTSGE